MLLPKAFLIFLLFLVSSLKETIGQTTPDLKYSELVALNASCSPKDTCVRELSKSRDLVSLSDRNCACDSSCVVYGDCCIDAPARTSKPSSPEQVNGWVCKNLTQFGGIIMKNTCPVNWTGPLEVRQKCESEDTSHGADPLSIMPVTNRVTAVTYLNYHCAFCNGDTEDSVFWLPRLEFDYLEQYNRTFQNISGQFIMKNLEYFEDKQSWGIKFYGGDGQEYVYYAKVYPSIPQEVEGLVRQCRKSLTTTCSPAWLDPVVRAKCSSYEAAIYLHDLTKNVGYKNPHCALCNFVSLSRLVCKAPAAKSEVEERAFNFQALSVIVDFNDAKGNTVGQEELCYNGEVYDPFQKKCRNLVCGFPGYVLVNNKCVKRTPKPKATVDDTVVAKTSTTTISTTTFPATTSTSTVSTTTFPPTTSTSTTTTTTVPTTTTTTTTTTTSAPTTTSAEPNEPVTTLLSTFTGEVNTLLPVDPLKYDTFTTEDGSIQMVTLSKDDPVPSTTEYPKRDTKADSRSVSMTEETSISSTSTGGEFYSEDFIECPKVPVQPKDVKAFENGTIYVIPYDRFYGPYQYLVSDNQVLVCAFFLNDTRTEQAKFSLVLGYITVVGLSISMFCLLLHVIVFVVVKELHNLSTRNLASFSLSLFFAYFCFTIGNITTLSKLSCVTLAVTTCYFFLVSFFWMNTMSYDVWRTLRLATQELRVSSGKQWKRFIIYSSYSWGIPAAIVTAALIVDNVDGVPNDFRPGFGVRSCWFSERKALLVFFATPLIAIMLANIGFFVSSAKMILSTSHTTSNNYSVTPRRNFKLYLRLGVMMGLTWTFGIIAGYLDLETLWYVFIILNTLQGLFIFVAFTCNRKVKKFLTDRCQALGKGRQAYRSSSLNSGSGFNSNSTFPSSNNSRTKSTSCQMNETKTSLMSPEKSLHQVSPMTSPPDRSNVSFKHIQAGMETLY